ncbi:FtsW/RodA/SpoVE family cell cycle protein [Solibacillus daqui]|uniref:FtsW/RodA/SpoVE family cell cycle protein n=1 Tax=Solibacillus daqui TaxID=2912187 RepID=UPI002366140E|nr:FtsW/RodA/SpoVE family cell cycle protein [Solibacillus daqui]
MSSKQFLQQVTSHIRSKEARGYVEEELQQHIAHSKQAWVNKGYSTEEAEQIAISEMGSPSQLGKSMDKIHRPKWDFWLIGAVILLVAASFVPIFTMDLSMQYGQNIVRYLIEQKIIHIILAILLIVACIFVDYRKLQRYRMVLYTVALLLLMMMLFIRNETHNGEAMFRIGPILFQAWTVLPLLVVAFAGIFAESQYNTWQLTGLIILPLAMFLMVPNLAVAMLYIAVMVILFSFSYYTRKIKLTVFSIVGGVGIVSITYLIYAYHYLLAPYQYMRIKAFLHPELYPDSAGYMILQIKAALAKAGWFGSETIYYLPEGHTDFALVQLIQTYGYSAGITVIVVILAIAIRILWILRTMPQSYGRLLVLSVVTLYSVQSVYSILMVFGLLPITEIPLPFISYGITPYLLNALIIGVVLSVYRRKLYMTKRKVIT